MYFYKYFPPLYVLSKIDLSTIRFFNTHLFSNVVIMTLNYFLCPISVHDLNNVHFVGIYIFPLHQHTVTSNNTIRQKHSTKILLYHHHKGNIERRSSIRGWPIVVREIATLI